jgi:hypothetical protein
MPMTDEVNDGVCVHASRCASLGLSVECPSCGRIARSVELVADLYKRLMGAFKGSTDDLTGISGPPTSV